MGMTDNIMTIKIKWAGSEAIAVKAYPAFKRADIDTNLYATECR